MRDGNVGSSSVSIARVSFGFASQHSDNAFVVGVLLACLPVFLFSGCRLARTVGFPGTAMDDAGAGAATVSAEELRRFLEDYSEHFAAVVEHAASEVVRGDSDRALRRSATEWKLRTIPACRQAVLYDDPIVGFLDLWSLTVQMTYYFTDGEGVESLGERRHIAVSAGEELLRSIEGIGARLLSADRFARAQSEIHGFARENPIRGGFPDDLERPSARLGELGGGTFEWAFAIPLSPFRALEGIDEGAESIREFTEVTDRLARFVEELPTYVRWEAELYLYELEESPSLASFLSSLESVSVSSKGLAQAAEGLPGELRETLTASLDGLAEQQASFRRTLDETRKTLREGGATIESVESAIDQGNTAIKGLIELGPSIESTARELGATSEGLAAAGLAWEGAIRAYGEMVLSLRSDEQKRSEAEMSTLGRREESEGRPFDVTEYSVAAENITQAAGAVRGLFHDIRSLADDPSVSQGVSDVSDAAVDRASSAVSRILREATVCLGFLILLVVSSIFGLRIHSRRTSKLPVVGA